MMFNEVKLNKITRTGRKIYFDLMGIIVSNEYANNLLA